MVPEQVNGFGTVSQGELAELRKALQVGYTRPVAGNDALRVESLDATLKLITYQAEHIKLWNRIPKMPAYSTVEEYNRLDNHGGDIGAFVPSGILPEAEDSAYSRQVQNVKYLGTTRAVHHPAILARTMPADLIAAETQSGALWLLGRANLGLYYGDADIVPEEWNGLPKQIISGGGHVMDLRGEGLSSTLLEDAAQLITDNYGMPTSMFANSKVFTDFDKAYHSSQRWAAPGPTIGMGGTPLSGWRTLVGDIAFESDVFLKKGGPPPSSATHPNAPPAPIGGTIAPVNAADTVSAGNVSQFSSADAGSYRYRITAYNRFGESAPTPSVNAVAVVANGSVAIGCSRGSGGGATNGFKFYRSALGGAAGTETWTHVQIPANSAGNGTWVDVNADLPGMYRGLILDMSNQSLTFKQLAPMMKMDLALLAPSIRWMQLLYGTPIVFNPHKNIVVKNIGA